MTPDAPPSTIRASRLSSGLRLVTERMAEARSVAVGFWVGTGSRDEAEGQAGASHFLEHLLFKGTASRTAAAIAEALDEVGGDCNAFTSKEYTTFYVRLLAEHLWLGLDILVDIMSHPALRPDDVEAERSVILDEILMHADEPSELAAEHWAAALFPGHPLGRDPLGSAESVGATPVEDIRAFFERHYRPHNMVVSAAGDCDHAALAQELERRLDGLGGSPPRRRPPARAPEPLVVLRRPTEQAHLVLGTRSIPRSDERRWAFALFNQVLGGGLSSRLFQRIREERGLAYSVGSERAAYEDTGSLAVVAGTAPEHVSEVLRLALGEVEQLATNGPTSRELEVAKSNLRADVILASEDSGARMSRIGSALLLHDRVLTVDEVLGRIDAVGLEEVRAAASEVATSPKTLAAAGPLDEDDLGPVGDLVAQHS